MFNKKGYSLLGEKIWPVRFERTGCFCFDSVWILVPDFTFFGNAGKYGRFVLFY